MHTILRPGESHFEWRAIRVTHFDRKYAPLMQIIGGNIRQVNLSRGEIAKRLHWHDIHVRTLECLIHRHSHWIRQLPRIERLHFIFVVAV